MTPIRRILILLGFCRPPLPPIHDDAKVREAEAILEQMRLDYQDRVSYHLQKDREEYP